MSRTSTKKFYYTPDATPHAALVAECERSFLRVCVSGFLSMVVILMAVIGL